MGAPPRKPSGIDAQSHFMAAVWDFIWGGGARIRGGPGVKVKQGPGGTSIEVDVPKSIVSAPGASPADWYTLIQPFGTYCVCQDSGGNIVRIAKPFELWNTILAQTIFGQGFKYTYPNDGPPPAVLNKYSDRK